MVTSPVERLFHAIVEPGRCMSGIVSQGSTLRVINLEGRQTVDFCSFNLADRRERFDGPYSQMFAHRYRLGKGDKLYSRECRPLWTIVEDSCGEHYSGGGYCSVELNEAAVRHGVPGVIGQPGQVGCRELIEAEVARYGMNPLDLDSAAGFNLFMTAIYRPDGKYEISPSSAKTGDHIDLRAEMDVLWVGSVCPLCGPINGDRPKRIAFELYVPASRLAAEGTVPGGENPP